MQKYLNETKLLDFSNKRIQQLIKERNWKDLDLKEQIKAIYLFVRDEMAFGYNLHDEIPASKVLKDGYGQCNTKSTLLMALLRVLDIPCRFHGFTIDKALQQGAIKGIWYKLAPQNIVHSWVEVFYKNQWFHLEGVILDRKYLEQLQNKFSDCNKTFCGYGAFTDNFRNPEIDWQENHTYIQKLGINQDFGLFDNPDSFYKDHGQDLSFLKSVLFRNLIRHLMNKNVNRIRTNRTD
ncbi:transglutaminase family protein [Fulvivirgaceae bacterium BMA10]|uniref:Transglutaminase family protein n=1 Tax=Splendidivirga corallicola TaxID=3051826 RepID=A0ABT8KHB1_9BACT|nr:transglutaminase family protein [Fulvivirgaceae bacterium BMA10]